MELKLRTVYVVGQQSSYVEMFRRRKWWPVEHIEDADLVQFCGGEDVSPCMYGEKPHPSTRSNPDRDRYERGIYDYALSLGLPMAGICRGGQFLHVVNGGKMWQDVNNHTRTHFAAFNKHSKELTTAQKDNLLYATKDSKGVLEVTSTHHQMMREPYDGTAVLLMTANVAIYKEAASNKWSGGEGVDIESLWYPGTRCLCYQPHPEHVEVGNPCQVFYFSAIENLIFGKGVCV